MRRMLIAVLCALLFGAAFIPAPAAAGVDVNINIGLPPPVVFPAPPLLLPIPGIYAYFAPDVDVDIIFYRGYWYRPHLGHWYRSDRYDGRWVFLEPRLVPRTILNLPPDWKRVPPGHEKIPYGQVKKNWRQWERDRHWDKGEAKQRDRREDRRNNYEKRQDKREGDRGDRGKGKGGRGKHRD